MKRVIRCADKTRNTGSNSRRILNDLKKRLNQLCSLKSIDGECTSVKKEYGLGHGLPQHSIVLTFEINVDLPNRLMYAVDIDNPETGLYYFSTLAMDYRTSESRNIKDLEEIANITQSTRNSILGEVIDSIYELKNL